MKLYTCFCGSVVTITGRGLIRSVVCPEKTVQHQSSRRENFREVFDGFEQNWCKTCPKNQFATVEASLRYHS